MAKGNDKKVVKQARELLLASLGNLLESHRERRFLDPKKKTALSRNVFCEQTHLELSTVAHIETGRFLSLGFPTLRHYLATTHGKNDVNFTTSAKRVYDG